MFAGAALVAAGGALGGCGGRRAIDTTGTGGGGTGGSGGAATAGTGGGGTTGTSRGGAGGGSGGISGGNGGFGTPSCTLTAQGLEPRNGQPCETGDPQLCYRTCGPETIGVKSETCISGTYSEMTGCLFDPARDYSCYRIPSTVNAACPAGVTPMASAACNVPTCTVCNSTGGLDGGEFLDFIGVVKRGYCVCSSPSSAGTRTWSCASNAWPCPDGPGC